MDPKSEKKKRPVGGNIQKLLPYYRYKVIYLYKRTTLALFNYVNNLTLSTKSGLLKHTSHEP